MPTIPGSRAGWYERDRMVVLAAPADVLAFTPKHGTVAIGIVMPPRSRVVDVSAQPSAAMDVLAATSRSMFESPARLESAARAAALDAAAIAEAPLPDREVDTLGLFGAIAFPILSAAYDLGAAPVGSIPRWSVRVLERPTVGDAARVAFGPSATRTVRRAMVEVLRPLEDGSVDLSGLALALMAGPVVQPDRLARVLSAPRVRQDPASLPDPATLRSSIPVLERWGAVRVERVLTEAAGRANGLALVLRTLAYAADLGDHGPSGPLPHRLQELHDVHRVLVRSAPAEPTPPPPAAEPAVQREVRAARPRTPPPPHRALAPPTTGRVIRPDAPIRYRPDLQRLDGSVVSGLKLVLPRTAGDLDRWGRIMSNCLGDFASAAVTGRSVIIGVERANRLDFAVEMTAAGTVRQFCGRANRAPGPAVRRSVVSLLIDSGVLDTGASSNRPWLVDVRSSFA